MLFRKSYRHCTEIGVGGENRTDINVGPMSVLQTRTKNRALKNDQLASAIALVETIRTKARMPMHVK